MLHEQQLPLLRCQSSCIAAATGMGLRALLLLLVLALAFLAVQWSPRLLQPQSRSTLRLDASAPSARRLLTSGAAVTPPWGAAADDIGQVRLSRTVGLVLTWLPVTADHPQPPWQDNRSAIQQAAAPVLVVGA